MAGITGSDAEEKKSESVEKVDGKTEQQNGQLSSEESSAEKVLTPIKTEVIMNGTRESSGEDSGLSSPVSIKNDDENKSESKDGEKDKGKDGEKEEEGKGEQEIVLIQDTGFTVQLAAPGMENIELPVSSMELVQEIHQVLMDREDTCHRTCFSLQLEGVTMDNFAELKSIEGLKEGSVIKVVEEPYTVREARIHVRHIRDLLKSVDHSDCYNGIDCNSLSFLNTITAGDILDKKRSKPDSLDCTPPDYIMPNSKERPLLPLHPGLKEMKGPQCIKVLTYSGWNPPPGNRKMHGDLLYLYVVTLEDRRYHITASTQGFYINQSTEEEFSPKAAQQKYLSHSLIDLLSLISPAFKRNFTALLKKRGQKHPFERVPTPYQVFSWMAPQPDHSIDYIRAEDAFSTRLGYEEHIPGQTRDWNEEIQTTRELPRKTLPERLIRERAIFKVHSDFVGAATRGAMAVIDGNVMAINPGEEAKMQMFIWNNIFFSLGFDVKDHYKDFGGDAAAYVAPGNDLQGVKAYFGTDTEGLYTLGTVVVDYRGYRVTAQSIIPGILEREQEQSVVYGSIDFGKTIVFHKKYEELLTKTASQLKIRHHKVLNEKGDEVELYSSLECKGIIGNDQRHYILDLLRTYPPDVNYLDVAEEELSQAMREQGYPKKHRHKLSCLRGELIDIFYDSKWMDYYRNAAYQFQQLRLERENKHSQNESDKVPNGEISEKGDNKTEEKEDGSEKDSIDEAKKIVEALSSSEPENDEIRKEMEKRAARAVGSLSDTEFCIAFNPDVFQSHVKHANPDSEILRREKQCVIEAAEFLVQRQIPAFVKECMEHTSSPIDGITLTEQMHQKGINMRYLGKIAEVLKKFPSVQYVCRIVIGELVSRSAKHLFKLYMQGVDMMNLSAAISHFLNCLLGSLPNPHVQVTAEELHGKKARRKNSRKNKTVLLGMDNTDWVNETPKTLWKKLIEEVQDYYHYEVNCDSVDTFVEKYGVQRVSLLRSFCNKAGIQVLLREYNLDVKNKQIFYEEDIINIFPVVKHVQPKASDASNFFSSGHVKYQQCLLRESHDLISEALNLLNNVYGAMHPDIAQCLQLLARLNYMLGDYSEAMSYQQRAVLMSERVLGIDHPNTITEYAHLAMYCFANSQVSSALRLLYRARYLAILCHGEDHPEVAIIDSNIGLILHAVEEFDLSLRFLEHALELNCKYFGAKSLKGAMTYHWVAWTHSCRGDFRAALQSEKEAYTIYKQLLGEEHERTKESSNYLKRLTQNAVNFQKKMNEIYKGEKNFRFPPLEVQRPSIGGVLEMLNHVNGTVFVHIGPEELEKLRQVNLKFGLASQSESDLESKTKEVKEEDLPNGHSEPNGDLDIEMSKSGGLDLKNNAEVTVSDGQ